MNQFWQFVVSHHTVIALAGAWCFSAACSTMPALPQNAGYLAIWVHGFFQALAANMNKLPSKEVKQ